MESIHKTVLLKETIQSLNLKDNSMVLDCTFGGGGHSLEILKRYPSVKIVAIDQDKGAFEKAREKFKGLEDRITFINKNFRDIEGLGNFDGMIFDLGLSSDQLENSGRGFSFMKDEPLLMTMKEEPSEEDLTAREIVNNWDEENIAKIIYGYGQEKFSRKIARAIVEAREGREIKTTFDLVKILESAIGRAYKKERIHFATRTFQALRIAVNDELGALQMGLEKGFEVLKEGGRMAVITFHSLEDRIVKRFYKNKEKESKAILMHKKPIVVSEEELKINPRARSAKLRILEKK